MILKFYRKSLLRVLFIAASFFVIFFFLYHPGEPVKQKHTFFAMGGIPVSITVVGIDLNDFHVITKGVEEKINTWENQLSLYRKDSVVNEISASPGKWINVPTETWEALQYSKEAYNISEGAFDITVGPLVKRWKQAEKENKLPSDSDIDIIHKTIGFNRILFRKEDCAIKIATFDIDDFNAHGSSASISIDIGGIAKGLFAEWILEYIESSAPSHQNLRKIVVNMGGDMFCRSYDPEIDCVVGIRDPVDKSIWGTLLIKNGAVVTSGTYERFYMIEDKKYNHIIDPRNGFPIQTDMVSATIWAQNGAIADALATAVFVLGEKKGFNLIQKMERTDLLIIRNDGSWKSTMGIQNKLNVLADNSS